MLVAAAVAVVEAAGVEVRETMAAPRSGERRGGAKADAAKGRGAVRMSLRLRRRRAMRVVVVVVGKGRVVEVVVKEEVVGVVVL